MQLPPPPAPDLAAAVIELCIVEVEYVGLVKRPKTPLITAKYKEYFFSGRGRGGGHKFEVKILI